LQQTADCFPVADITMRKVVSRIRRNRQQVMGIAGVSELVEIDHWSSFLRNPLQDEIGADEPGSSSDQNRFFHVDRRFRQWTEISRLPAPLIVIKNGRNDGATAGFSNRPGTRDRVAPTSCHQRLGFALGAVAQGHQENSALAFSMRREKTDHVIVVKCQAGGAQMLGICSEV